MPRSAQGSAARLSIGWSTRADGRAVDRKWPRGRRRRALLAAWATTCRESPQFDGVQAMPMTDVWFFGFDLRLAGYAKRGPRIGPDTLEPSRSRSTNTRADESRAVPERARAGQHGAAQARPVLHAHDVWLSPTTARVAEPWGTYNLGRADVRSRTAGADFRGLPVHAAAQHPGRAGDLAPARDAFEAACRSAFSSAAARGRARRPAARVGARRGDAVGGPRTAPPRLAGRLNP